MTIERQGSTFTISCDNCSNYDEMDTGDFHEAVAEAKRKKWKISRVRDEWTHTCPACRESDFDQ